MISDFALHETSTEQAASAEILDGVRREPAPRAGRESRRDRGLRYLVGNRREDGVHAAGTQHRGR